MRVSESVSKFLKPKGVDAILSEITHLDVEEKIEKLKKMQDKWSDIYDDLLSKPEIIEDLRVSVKEELEEKEILEKVKYINKLESLFPQLFSGMKDDKTIDELKDYILGQDFEKKTDLIWRFFRSWPDLFKDIEDDHRIDEETNKILLLFRIKRAIDLQETEKIQSFVTELANKYGSEEIMEMAEKIEVDDMNRRYGDRGRKLFNKRDLTKLELMLHKEHRTEEQIVRDDMFNIYAFIGYTDLKEKEVEGETFYKKELGIENLVKIDKYDPNSLNQVGMMKIRAAAQHQKKDKYEGVWGVYIPKHTWDRDTAYNDDIPDDLRNYIKENKFAL